MIKAIFFDVDGTLLSHDTKKVPQSTKEALKQLKKQNIKTFMATGRHNLELGDLPMEDLIFDGYILLNGQINTDHEGNLISQQTISKRDTETLVRKFKEKEIAILLIENNQFYLNMIDKSVENAQNAISSPCPQVKEYSGNPISQCCIYATKEQAEEFMKDLPDCKISQWNPYAYDILSKEGGKTAGIESILKYYGIKKEEIMAFGDGENDIEMLQYAKIGVAMGNAEDEVKEAADYVTDTVNQDGIYKALQYYEILK